MKVAQLSMLRIAWLLLQMLFLVDQSHYGHFCSQNLLALNDPKTILGHVTSTLRINDTIK